MASREELIKRAQLMQRAKSLSAQQTAEPIQAPATAEEAAEGDALSGVAGGVLGGLGGAAKGLDLARGSLTAPALAAALEMITGKDVYRGAEHFDAINPSNLSTFPGANELFERAGIPEGATLSDVVPMAPEGSPWYMPEEGGFFDFSVRGTGGLATDIAIDPLTYLSFGSSGLAKKAASETVNEIAKRGGKQGLMARTAQGAGDALNKMTEVSGLQGATRAVDKVLPRATEIATAPSRGVQRAGKWFYDSALGPVEAMGEKFGKADVGETLYRAGVASPFDLRGKGQTGINDLLNLRNQIADEAAEAGARVDVPAALREGKARVTGIRNKGIPEQQGVADALEERIKAHSQMIAPTPGIPSKTVQVPTGKLDWLTQPIMETKFIPGVEEVPGRVIDPRTGFEITSGLYNEIPGSKFNELLKSPQGAEVPALLSKGYRNETINAIERGVGPEQARLASEANREAGKLLSTKRAMQHVSDNANRAADKMTSGSGMEAVVGAAAGMKGILLKRTIDALRLGTMPIGYGVRKIGENQLLGPSIDIFTRRSTVEQGGRGSREERKERGS